MKTLIINDCHLGVKRQGGTTKESREALDSWMFQQFKNLLEIPHDEVVILGDLFDERTVSETVMLKVIQELKKHKCLLVLGNHDLGGYSGSELSSAEFVATLAGCEIIKEPTVHNDMYIIPHLFNQQMFDEAVVNSPKDCLVLTHCNINSNFATGDHSLNLSTEQITFLEGNGNKVIAAHEHAAREYKNVTVIGNQFPSSIADTLGGDKRCLIVKDGELDFIPTWNTLDFLNIDYTEDFIDKPFVRINGECELVEFPEVTRKIAKLRASSSAFIIANNVKVKTKDSTEVVEMVTAFNIIDLFMEQILPEFQEEVKSCI